MYTYRRAHTHALARAHTHTLILMFWEWVETGTIIGARPRMPWCFPPPLLPYVAGCCRPLQSMLVVIVIDDCIDVVLTRHNIVVLTRHERS